MTPVQWHQISDIDKAKARRAARKWRSEHENYVVRQMSDGHVAYPPSGSDIFRPELWKPAMWRWLARQDASFNQQ